MLSNSERKEYDKLERKSPLLMTPDEWNRRAELMRKLVADENKAQIALPFKGEGAHD